MKRTLAVVVLLIPIVLFAQSKTSARKYQGLLWEITGPTLKKPSYLFGTMHVSSKLAFHLADSFYLGIRNADIVALETNPESWQEDMSKYDLEGGNEGNFPSAGYVAAPGDYFTISTLRFFKYEKKVERALYSNPSTINNLLYRSYGNESSDFEEDTYLDMYIYQCGKKWGKKVAGVEKYGESMKLMTEAYKDAAKDRNRKERSYDGDNTYSSGKLQEAYRAGNLDWLDSINRYNSFSAAFDEKFLYRRNEIQAGSIDSILHSGQSLFVGVGAAHLPGNRGVIEILRRLGYKLRPVKMGARDSQHKNQVEKLRVPVQFNMQSAEDGWFRVEIPGKFYKSGDDAGMDSRQYADMANGSYYMVTRIMTNAWMWGHNHARVNRIVDSLLYENIPGKIVSKTAIVKNGYNGIDIVNKTRRGDMQRYNIFITPFEVMIFKMSGTGEYVTNGDEARRFFGSIQLKESKPNEPATTAAPAWIKFSPTYGGFAVKLPHEPYVGNDGSWIFDADDRAANAQYRVIRSDIHNYAFAEEDSFDLGLMDESFASSDFIDKQISRKQTTYKGYPALDCQYKDKYGGLYIVRFIIQGPHYYTLLAHARQETAATAGFFNSFEIRPYFYGASRNRVDTMMYYQVKSPVFPEQNKEKVGAPRMNYSDDDDEINNNDITNGVFRSKVISNDSTGEKLYVSFFKARPYTYIEDSTAFNKTNGSSLLGDTSWIVRSSKQYRTATDMKVWDIVLSDTNSSRVFHSKTFFKNGIGFNIVSEGDTLSQSSAFISDFYQTFMPVDSLEGIDPFRKKSSAFFADFMSSDTAAHKRAVKGLYMMQFDSTDLQGLKKIIGSLNWKEKKYLDVKKAMIGKLELIRSPRATDYLKELYYAAGDTLELQFAALEVMLQQKTTYSFQTFRDIVMNEPPVLMTSNYNSFSDLNYLQSSFLHRRMNYDNNNFMDDLDDSLQLGRKILPDILPLINLDDYEPYIMRVLAKMIDSSLVKPKDYETYFPKFLLEAKQEMKKQTISEKQKDISLAEKIKDSKIVDLAPDDMTVKDRGNDKLDLYATLLMPYWDKNPAVPTLFTQMLGSKDRELKYNTMLLMIRNKKSVPDSMLNYFAALDDYRYNLYDDLRDMHRETIFPDLYNNHVSVAKSKLISMKSNDRPDSIVYVDSLPASFKKISGFVYFFRYKAKKDDAGWKLASVGIVSQDPKRFDIQEPDADDNEAYDYSGVTNSSITRFGDTRLKTDDPLRPQLQKELKRLLYSLRRSASQFYEKETTEDNPNELEETTATDGGN